MGLLEVLHRGVDPMRMTVQLESLYVGLTGHLLAKASITASSWFRSVRPKNPGVKIGLVGQVVPSQT